MTLSAEELLLGSEATAIVEIPPGVLAPAGGDGEAEDAVAEELEPLVRGATVARPRRVREDGLRQLRRERVDQLREVPVRGYWCEAT